MTTTRTFTISPVQIPTSIESADAADFIAAIEVRNLVEAHSYGTDELSYSPAEILPRWLDPHKKHWMFVAWLDGRIVGRGCIDALLDEPDTCWLDLRVLPEYRRLGIGTALAQRVEDAAREDGRTKLIVYAVSAGSSGEKLPSPTGFGSVPRQNPEVRFLLGRGYSLEQVERGSRLALPVDNVELAERLAASAAAAGPDYRLHEWSGRVPARWLADMAALYTAMSTEEPSAGLEEPESVWTPERITQTEELQAGDGRISLFAVVEHLPTGRLCGLTVLSVPAESSRVVSQEDTLVMPAHRGHRLGTWMKIANLRQLQRDHPGHSAITTFNAEENRPMLDVNEAVGFLPMGYEGAWKKLLGVPES
ncbi:GNAT superfamily N-acetyltransferase [Nakamurella sp. UYEF19]|uniref:GNAT family N-acetyltransferase n=1 Tax=Nakamurella sp. UYEF19 TaxID=1756392 RepID=UPI0033990C65